MRAYKLILIILSILFILPLVSAGFPISHKYIISESIKVQQETALYKACKSNPDICFAGNLLADFTVIDYIESFERYSATHRPSFCNRLINSAVGSLGVSQEEELACAAGGCGHSAGDSHIHNELVPEMIRRLGMPNIMIHPFIEQKIDLRLIDKNPNIAIEMEIASSSYRKCVPLFKRVLSTDDKFRGVNLEERMDKFIIEVQGGKDTTYDISFKNISSIPFRTVALYISLMMFFVVISVLLYIKRLRFKDRRTVLNWVTFSVSSIIAVLFIVLFIANLGGQAFVTFSTFAKPISRIMPVSEIEMDQYIQNSITKTKELFASGEVSLFGIDGSGELALHEADEDTKSRQILLLIVVLGLTAFILWRNFRGVRPKSLTLGGL